jgi:hypothetical protein
MRTSFHHQPEAQHPNFQLSTSCKADFNPVTLFAILTAVPAVALPQSFPRITAGIE